MKVLKKAQAFLLCLALALLCIAPSFFGGVPMAETANAADEQLSEQANYFGTKLTDPVSVAFYNVLEGMNFASGESVSITDKTILDEAALYTVGNPSVMKKLGAAIDSFRYDHTEYFYVDFDMLTLNVKTRGNTLLAELGAGRSESYFVDGFNKDNVTAEITWYETELNKFVESIKVAENATTADKAKAVTKAVAEKITYSFCVDENGEDTEGAPFIRTAYGALKYGKGVCEGYSRLFKAAMDKLGVLNVLVNGWLADDETVGAHMWNLVHSGNEWHGVDPTVADEDTDTYDARGLDWAKGELLGIDHFVENIISTSNYKMPFPSIARTEIVESDTSLNQEVNGLKVVVSDDKKFATISYNGKDTETLKAEGLYMVLRFVIFTDGVENPNIVWEPISNYEMFGWVKTENGKTTFDLSGANSIHVDCLQFAICNAAADGLNPITSQPDRYTNDFFEEHVVAKTEKAFINENSDPNYKAPLRGTPDCSLITLDTTDGEQPRKITVKYSRKLEFDSPSDTVPVLTVSAVRIADGKPVDVSEFVSLTDAKCVGTDSISFVFRPSISYTHNEVAYKFHLENMHCVRLSEETAKPEDFSIAASRTSIVCNRVFGDGKLYVEAFGTPTLVDNSDLSMKGWSYKDKHGNEQKVSQSQRSQLALVVKTPANKEELENSVTDVVGADNVKMATYELDLNICKNITSIPQGSFLKLSFGFPDGITADMAGVGFEVFHFKKDASGNLDYEHPERLNCVLTKYGLTVTVDSFSPFVIVAREKTESDKATKGVLTALNGVGGTITANTNKPVNFLKADDESVTYTITPDEGYTVEYVLLGSKELKVENNKVTVQYSDLTESSTILSVGFAAKSVLEKEKAAGEVNATKTYAAKTYDKAYAEKPNYTYEIPTNGGLSGGMIALIVVAVIVVILGAVAICYFVFKKKKAQ